MNFDKLMSNFEWMNPISGMFTDNFGFENWLSNFESVKDIRFATTNEDIKNAYIVRGDNVVPEDIIVLGQWDFIKQTGWHSSDVEEI